jgi:hypothetical protein
MSREPETDDYMRQYLRGLDLQHLDLNHIDIEAEERAHRRGNGWRLLGLLAAIVGLLWLPTTNFYQLHSEATWVFFALFATAAALFASVARWLWEQAQVTADRYADAPPLKAPPMPKLSPRTARTLMLLGALGLGGLVLFALPRDAEWQGNGYSLNWFFGVGAAITTGILLGRWLIAQAAAKPAPRNLEPIVLPPWFKWANLAMLIAGGLFATFGHGLIGGADSQVASFPLAGVGFAVGIFGAIWIARRFDELEAKLRTRAENARRMQNL